MAIILNDVSYKNIKNLSFEIEEGKITGILSSTSEEKEELSKIIAKEINTKGLFYDYKGDKISYNEVIPDNMLIGLTVKEELILPLQRYSFREDTLNKKCEEALKIVSLDNRVLNRSTNDLSLSAKKLLTIAINLITNPKILVLNEPYMYLDNIYIKKLNRVLKKIVKRYNKTVIILSSNVNEIYNICDNYILLRKGKVLSKGLKKELIDKDKEIESANLEVPEIIKFINKANKEKNITLEKTYDVKELMKDVYRNAR